MQTPNRSLQRRIMFWNAAGSVASASQSFVFLIAVTRLCSTDVTGDYSLGYSISQLMWTIGVFEATTYFATDADDRFSASQYLGFKLLSCALMVLASVLYVGSFGFGAHTAALVFWLCAFKLVDAAAAYGYALYQKNGRLDLSGCAIFWQNLLPCLVFVPTLLAGGDVVLGMALATLTEVVWDALYYGYQSRHVLPIPRPDFDPRAMGALLVELLPLFVATYLANYLANIPKYAIEAQGSSQTQAVFGVLFMPSFVINLFMLFFVRPSLTVLAEAWSRGDRRRFLGITARLLGMVVAVSAVVLAGAWLVGVPLLQAVFGIGLEGQRLALVVVLAGGGLASAANILYNDLIILRRQRLVVVAYAVAVVVGMLSARPLVAAHAAGGASAAYCLSCAALLGAYAVLFAWTLHADTRARA